jgi:single-stranded DNA-binding protein
LLKGTQVCVTVDDLHMEEYQGRNGSGTKLVGRVTQIKLAGGRQDGASAPAAAPRAAPAPAPRPAPAAAPAAGGFSDMDDDIPF